jgi:Rod binding domain-containing protein
MGALSVPTVDPILYGSLARSSQEEGLAATVKGAKSLAGQKLKGPAEGEVDRLLGEFQNVLFSEMMKAMRASIPKSGLFEDNTAREIFQSLLDEQYAASFGDSIGSLGLTEALKIQLGLVKESSAKDEVGRMKWER